MISDLPPIEPASALHGSLALDVFGKSYHTNRDVRWNEDNPGLGVTVAIRATEQSDYLGSVGTYRDSFKTQAKYSMLGYRYIAGEREGLHACFNLTAGILDGSGDHGLAFVPILSIGYDRVDLCVTGTIDRNSDGQREPNGQADPRVATTSMIACLLSVTMLRF